MTGLIFAVTNLIVGLTCLILILILLKYGSKKVHYILAIFILVTGIWGFGGFFIGLAQNSSTAMIAWKIGLAGSIPSPVVLYHVVVLLGGLKRKNLLKLFYSYSFICYFLAFFNLAGLKITRLYNSIYYIQATDFRWWVLCTIWICIIFYTIFELYKLFRKSFGNKRIQYQYLLIAFIIGWTGAILDALPMIGFGTFPANNILIWLYCVIITYAILRHQLLDIEVIIKKTLVFAGLLASVFAILVLPTLLIQEYIFREAGVGGRVLGLTLSGIIIIFALRRIEDFLINITDRYLFQKKYDYKELLKTFTNEVLTVLNLNELTKLTVTKLSDIIKLKSCGVLLLSEDKKEYRLVASQGIKEKSLVLEMDNTLASFLAKTKICLSVSEHGKEFVLPKRIIQDMNKLKLELAIPLVTLHGEMIGILTLGKKKSDEDYTQDDMDILLPLTRTLSIAINNAEMFEELGKTQAEAAQREKMAVIGTLSAGINHEICNPLGIARGQCEAFLLNIKDGLYNDKTAEDLFEKAKIIMQKVIHETDRATAITKRLSTFAKPSKGVISDDVNVKNEIAEVLALIGYEMKLDKIDITKEIDENLPLISGDKKQLQEVFFNLIRNAAQAINEKGKIIIRARNEGDKVIINIEDTGHGIPEAKLEQIFNPFYTTKDPGKGTGLGLFIVRQVVERNKGRISVRSKVGRGTTFSLEFPAAVKEKVK